MSEPSFTYARGIAAVKWSGEHAVEMMFDRIREDRKTHEVGAEVTYSVEKNGDKVIVHRARLNATSTRGKQDAARYLASLAGGPNWSTLIETACWQVVDSVRRGRPAIVLGDAVQPEGDGTLLDPLLLPNDPVIIFGDGGSAKSYLALSLALSVQSGKPYAGIAPAHQLRCAYLDFEWGPWPHKKRMQALCGDDPAVDLLYVPCLAEGPLSAQSDRLRRIFHEHGTQYVVIDSVALACAGPPEEAGVALDFFESLAQLEVGSLLLAHVNRSGDEDRPFGSTFWHNSARMTWFAKARQDPGQPRLDLALYNRKINDGPRPGALALHFEFAPTKTTITRADIRDIPELSGKLPLKEQIAGILATGAQTVSDIADMLDVEQAVVRTTLNREKSRFTQLHNSHPAKWCLPIDAEQPQ